MKGLRPCSLTESSRATIRDVALLSSLSICTVSRALRGLPNVSEDAQRRVEDAASKLGYRASSAAARLAGGRTGSVAIIVPRATTWFFAQAVEAAEEVFADSGLDSVLISLRGRADVRERIFGDLDALAQRVDGVLLLGVDLCDDEVQALAASPLEVASMGLSGVPWDTVGIDDVQAAHAATSHLLGLGHGEFAILAADEDDRGTVGTSGDRLAGFTQALAEQHLEVHPDRIIKEPSSIEGGYRAMTELIDNRGLPEAVFAACDEAAFGALKALREHGLSAPKDVSLIAIDDHPMSTVLGLTTVAQPVADQAAFAADLLTERLQGRSGAPQDHRLPVALIERKTTRRPRRQP